MIDWAELTDWHEYSKLFIGLFALVSPPIILPLFMGVVGNRAEHEKKQTALVGTLTFAVVMLTFTFLGTSLLGLFGITIPAFRIAGGLLLLLMALEMMRSDPAPQAGEEDSERDRGEHNTSPLALGIVPLAIPILAGPGAISTLVIFANLHENFTHKLVVGIVVLVITVYVYAAFRLSIASGRLIGRTTTVVFYRVMGLIISAIAVEFILDGIAGHFPQVFGPLDH
jgi:multiple antibiotic resistance protein